MKYQENVCKKNKIDLKLYREGVEYIHRRAKRMNFKLVEFVDKLKEEMDIDYEEAMKLMREVEEEI